MAYIKAVLLGAGLILALCCSTPSLGAAGGKFAEVEATNFIVRYYSDDTSYMLKPLLMEGTFRTICNRAQVLKLAEQQPGRNLAVVLLIHYRSPVTENSVKVAWANDLKGLGYQRIVFLCAGKGMEVKGLPILESPSASAAPSGK